MKKTISLLLSVLMLLSLCVCAFAEGEDLIPGTEFPLPDALTSVKAVSVDQMQEKSILEILGVDVLIDVFYEDAAATSQAFEEYRSALEQLFPDFTDSKGNVITLPDSVSYNNLSITVNLNKEPISFIGKESIGWFDISSCNDRLTEVQYDQHEERMGVGPKDNLAVIQCEMLMFGGQNPDFAHVCEVLLRGFTLYNNGEPIPESENAYKNIVAAELELDGAPAYKVSYETADPWGRCETQCGVSYVTTNPTGGYVRINIHAPKEGHLDKDGNPYRPTIEDLTNIIENTYTRTEP